jgi:hypothetical protein
MLVTIIFRRGDANGKSSREQSSHMLDTTSGFKGSANPTALVARFRSIAIRFKTEPINVGGFGWQKPQHPRTGVRVTAFTDY